MSLKRLLKIIFHKHEYDFKRDPLFNLDGEITIITRSQKCKHCDKKEISYDYPDHF